MNLYLRKSIKVATYGLLALAAVCMSFLVGNRATDGYGDKVTSSDFNAGVPIAYADAPGVSVISSGDDDDDGSDGADGGGCDGSDDDDDG